MLAPCPAAGQVDPASAPAQAPPIEAPDAQTSATLDEAVSQLDRQASMLLREGRVREALPLLQRRWQVLKHAYGPKHPRTLGAMKPYGEALKSAGRGAESMRVLREAMDSILELYGERHPASLVAENDYALGLVDFGDAGGREALERFVRLHRISTEVRGPLDAETLTIANNLAVALMQQRRFAEAAEVHRDVHRKRLRVLGERHPLTLQSASTAAAHDIAAGAHARAIPALERVLADEIAWLGERNPETLRTMGSLALALGLAGRKEESLRLNRHLFEVNERLHGERLPAGAMIGLIQLLIDLGRDDQALPLLERFVRTSERERQEAALVSTEAQQSLHALHLGWYRLYAQRLVQRGAVGEAFTVVERTKARGLIDQMATAAALDAGVVPPDAAATLRELADRLAELDTRFAAAADGAARERLRADRAAAALQLADLQVSLKERFASFRRLTEVPPAGAGDAARLLGGDSLFISYVVDADRVESYTLSSAGVVGHQAARTIGGLADAVEAFRLLHAMPQDRPLRDSEGAALEVWRWQGSAGPHWRAAERSRCAGRGDGPVAAASATAPARPPAPASAQGHPPVGLDRACPPPEAQRVHGSAARAELAAWLGQALIEPLRSELAGKRRLIVSPDGPLAMLPFDLLRVRGKRLVETHDTTLVHSLSVLARLRQRLDQLAAGPPRQALLAMGNPNYQSFRSAASASTAGGQRPDARGAGAAPRPPWIEPRRDAAALAGVAWDDLPWTAHEIESASRLFADRGSMKLERDDASEARLRRLSAEGRLAGFRYLLFSAHGYFDPGAPAASALVLARDGDEPERDGLLTVAEWPSLRLRSELVVMSACDTGRGALVSGEGLVGLGYALFVAGNVSTVVTLWPIADRATATFVSSFLAKVKSGRSLGAALSATKREFLRHPDVALRDPFYWAAFVINGI